MPSQGLHTVRTDQSNVSEDEGDVENGNNVACFRAASAEWSSVAAATS